MDTHRSQRPTYMPRPETIRRECQLIQSTWTQGEEYRRRISVAGAAIEPPRPLTVTECRGVDMEEAPGQ